MRNRQTDSISNETIELLNRVPGWKEAHQEKKVDHDLGREPGPVDGEGNEKAPMPIDEHGLDFSIHPRIDTDKGGLVRREHYK